MTDSTTLKNWQVPAYRVRRSGRAKRLQFRVTANRGLEVIVPKRLSLPSDEDIQSLLFENRAWLTRHQSKIDLAEEKAQSQALNQEPYVPKDVFLKALEQTWKIEKCGYVGKAKWIEKPNQVLVLLHDYSDDSVCYGLLIDWLREKAFEFLSSFIREVSRECELPFNNMTVRAQQTRWGSCSSDKSISLNFKLLFFPKAVVRYILVHELAHTVHMNHSNAFWAVVAKHDPNYRRHDAELKKENQYFPTWLQ